MRMFLGLMALLKKLQSNPGQIMRVNRFRLLQQITKHIYSVHIIVYWGQIKMIKFMKPFSADMCEMLHNMTLQNLPHGELSKIDLTESPCKVYVYCTQAESKNKTFEKGKVVGEYTIYKSFYCDNNKTALGRAMHYLTRSSGIIDFEKTPMYVLIPGKFYKYEIAKDLDQFVDINNDPLTRAPMRRMTVNDRY